MTDEKIIKDAQYRKGLGIAWFNSNNGAVEMVKLDHALGIFNQQPIIIKKGKTKIVKKIVTLEDRLDFWQDRMLKKYDEFYSTIVANIGTTYSAPETIARINSATTIEELKSIWITLSESERYDATILKAKEILKKKLK